MKIGLTDDTDCKLLDSRRNNWKNAGWRRGGV